MEPLFTVEMIEAHPRTKDHLPVSRGEELSVLLAEHPQLPMGKYIAEKEDGQSEFPICSSLKHPVVNVLIHTI